MTVTIMPSILGIIAFDEKGEILKIHEFPPDPNEIAKIFLDIKTGITNDRVEEFMDGLELRLHSEDKMESWETDDPGIFHFLEAKKGARAVLIENSSVLTPFRHDLVTFLRALGNTIDLAEFHSLNREVNLELTKLQIRSTSEQHDKLIMQAVNSIDDIDKSTNIYSERIREWYGHHFPELTDRLISDHQFFLEMITEIGRRQDFTPEKLVELRPIQEPLVERIMQRAGDSMGGELSPYDIHVLQEFARAALQMYKVREQLESYVDSLMEQLCPNMSKIINPILGARLICLAGGLETLAKKPSSTIQVLGAEKALFKAIKTHGDPPKHGIIFQSSYIRNAQYWQRGKVARLLAGKLSIAVKVDSTTKRYIADDLLNEIDEKLQEIQRKYPKPPKKKKSSHKGRHSSKHRSTKSRNYHGKSRKPSHSRQNRRK
ncbi:hypothetical protein GF325_00450 [Candidatus Bathyarchaeota archaeon]|nr:hypothetical protein [Candidatus Bathyarchaeota archaeon]